jgi:hypothetical protein
MGDGATVGNFVIHLPDSDCKARPAGARGSCYTIDYLASAQYTTPVNKTMGVCNWGGLFWQYPANNWGQQEGLPVPTGKLTKLSAMVAVAAGTESFTFQLGGIGLPPNADGTPAPPPAGACPPAETPTPPHFDEISATLTEVIGTDWQKVEIPITARAPAPSVPAMTRLIGAFSWSVSANSGLPKTIYVDDLVFE